MNLTAIGIKQAEHYLFTPLLGEDNSIVQATTLIKKGEELNIGRHRFVIYSLTATNKKLVVNLFNWPPRFSLPELMIGPIDVNLLKYRYKNTDKDFETMAELWDTTPQSLVETILLIYPQKNNESIN